MATTISMTEHEISNGLCRFSPTSTKGKWIFLLQTILISFIPIGLLMIQNGVAFNDMLVRKQGIQDKDQKVCNFSSIVCYKRILDSFLGRRSSGCGQTDYRFAIGTFSSWFGIVLGCKVLRLLTIKT